MKANRWPRVCAKVLIFVIALCLGDAWFMAANEAFAVPPPAQVLLLNSYHPGFAWTDSITRGVEHILAAAGTPVELTVEYMDAKRKNDAGHYANLFDLYRGKFLPQLFNAVIAADDDALLFAMKYREQLFPGVPLVFCGFSHDPGALLAGQRGVTGIVETQDVGKTIALALTLHPDTRKVVVINDLTTTGLARQRKIDEVAQELFGRIRVETIANVTAEQLENRMHELKDQDLVFLQMFDRDSAGRVFDPQGIMALLGRSCRRPIYTVKEGYLGLGVIGGYLTTGTGHGEAAARTVLRILEGADPGQIPVIRENINPPMFDDGQLRRFRIDPGRLPPGSIRINVPVPFYLQYRKLVAVMVSAFVILLLVIVVLTANVRIRRRAEEDLAITLFSIGDAVIATDRQGRVARVNPVAERLTGWSAGEARGQALGTVIQARDIRTRLPVTLPIEAVIGRGETANLPEETILVARDGSERRIQDSIAPIRDHRGIIRGMVFVFRDVTEKELIEERLRQAQKMETVGRLAGGIAHDFNNLLGGIIGYADLLIIALAANERLRHHAERIVETAERAAGLTRNLLAFSRKGQLHAVDINLHQVIHDVVGILEQTIDRRITLATRLAAGSPLVNGDLSQIQSALLNLGVNARDAMPEGGALTFATAEVDLDDKAAQALSEPIIPGRYVEIRVSDTGVGMTPEVIAHLFEPFFSTKPRGKGTGLGLAAVYGTVRAHRGAIEVQSAPGGGTAFRVYLPVSGETSAPTRVEERRTSTGAGCILLVDDEKIIRNMARDMLKELGYDVLTAADGEEALEVFRRERDRIILVILDVVMPKCNGPEAVRAMQAIVPGVRILLSSGFDFDTATRDLMSEGVAGFLQKPFRITELSRKITEVLGKAPGS